jgi:hydroxyethylthiazole kinase
MISKEDIIELKDRVKENAPLVHNITNYVVMNSTANALLSVGASPVMAHAVDEVEDMTGIASSLVINMGTLSEKWIEAMLLAGKKAKERGIPVIFDPVGVGATAYRNETAAKIISLCKPSIIRGNASEIMALCNTNVRTKGVDSTMSTNSALDSGKLLAKEENAIVVLSGEVDYITDGNKVVALRNGSELMARVTGMGCTATAIIGAYAGVEENKLKATVAAMAVMGIAGEISAEKSSGNGSMQMNFLDTLYTLDNGDIESKLKLNHE